MTEITRIMIQLRAPRGSDAGKIAEGHYKVEDDTVLLCDKFGSPVDRYRLKRRIPPGVDARTVAGSLLRERYSASNDSFNRPINYGPGPKY